MNHSPADWSADRFMNVAAVTTASLHVSTDQDWFPSIPLVWQMVRFKFLFHVIYRYPTYFNIEYAPEGIPEVRGEALTPDGFIERLEDERYISPETNSQFPMTQLEIGDIVMSVRGTMGKVGIVDERYAGANITANLLRLSPDQKRVTGEFLRWLMRSTYFNEALNSSAPQTTIKTITMPQLAKLRVALPPLPEQKRIAAFLDASCAALDSAVAAKRKQLKTLEAYGKSLIHEYVTGQRRIDELKETGCGNTENAGNHAKRGLSEWSSDRLKDVAAINAVSLPASTDPDCEFDYLEIANVNYYGVIDSTAIERFRYEDAPSRARRCVNKNSTVISSVRPNLQAVAFLPDARSDFVCSTGFNVVQPYEPKLMPKFLHYALISDVGRQYFEAAAKGVGYPAVDDKDFNSFYVPLPPLSEQKQIVVHLDAKLAEIKQIHVVIDKQISTLLAYRKSFIHECVTGQRRVTEEDINKMRMTPLNKHDIIGQ